MYVQTLTSLNREKAKMIVFLTSIANCGTQRLKSEPQTEYSMTEFLLLCLQNTRNAATKHTGLLMSSGNCYRRKLRVVNAIMRGTLSGDVEAFLPEAVLEQGARNNPELL
jgi:hypothetical protein